MPDHPRPTPLYLAWLLPLTVAFLSLGILLGRAADVWQPALAALLLSALAALLSQGWRTSTAMLLAASALGALLGWQAYHPPLPEERNYQVHGTIAQELHLREDGQFQTRCGGKYLMPSNCLNNAFTPIWAKRLHGYPYMTK